MTELSEIYQSVIKHVLIRVLKLNRGKLVDKSNTTS